MKRFILGLSAALIAVCGAMATPLRASAQSTSDFTIRSFDADYYLGKDKDGRSTLKTVEKITAVFPDYNQNHGLERAIPKTYDSHSTNLQVQSVTDANGVKLNYSETTSGDNRVLRIGDVNTYVHGAQEYIITYMQQDVSRFFQDTNDDEFYWDINGTQWAQFMDTVSARVHISPSLALALTSKASCYQGREGSTDKCAISRATSTDGEVFSVKATMLGPYQNMTLAIGFAPHTFAAYQPTWQEKTFALLVSLWILLFVVESVAAVIAIIWMAIRRRHIMNRVRGRGTIVVEYLPPKDASVLLGAQVLGDSPCDMTAQLIDLAVRHYLKIYQTKDKTMFKPAEYELEIAKDVQDLRPEELRLLRDLFGKSNIQTGGRFAMKNLQNNYSLGQKLLASRKQLRGGARGKYGIFERAAVEAKRFKKFGFVAVAVGIITLSPLVVVAAIIAFVFAYTLWPLTEKGVALRDYLAGLREYISVAEDERLKMLQSPAGAEKVGVQVDGHDPKQLVKLYERVLSYAVLFGIEKQWTKQLGAYYEASTTQPDWYSGNTAFNAVVFSSALNNFSAQGASYGSSSSSSSGGSDGGGFSGGGGGGGGGGGW